MKTLKNSIAITSMLTLFIFTSCGKTNDSDSKSGSDSQTTANDSSKAESRSAMGVNEDNQDKVAGYPSNQSNLNSDSTSKLHDVDTTHTKTTQPKK
ncbi:hypothetical protein [Dyadobacter sp. NIV53]|uniref:hypothetical protein n=1 Tax=Dyadobacter sp. NIV53 TaxID=2861765 RepID=UPI001C88D7F2|nr:hypothetical protein [Dyadobacter sp. NIV53]